MVSGQQDTAPNSRRPRRLAAEIFSRSSNTERGLVLLCSSAATTTGRPESAASSSRKSTFVWPPLVSMNTPRPASFRQPTRARISASSARREGIGMPPWPLWLGEVVVAKPTAPARMPSEHDVLHFRDFGGGGRAPGRLFAHHVGAHRRVADEAGDVQRHALALEHGEEFRDGLEVPAHAGAQHFDRHAFDLGEVLQDQVAVGGAAGRDGEAAVADDGGGDAERRRGRGERIPGELRVVVRVVVDDAGHQRQAVGVEGLFCRSEVFPHPGYSSLCNGKVAITLARNPGRRGAGRFE